MKTAAIFAGGVLYLFFMVMNLISLLSGAGFAFVPFLVVLLQILFVLPIFLYLRKSTDLGNYALSLLVVTALVSVVMYGPVAIEGLAKAPTSNIDDASHQLSIDMGKLEELKIEQAHADPHDKDAKKEKRKALKEHKKSFDKDDRKGFQTTAAQLEADRAVANFDRKQRTKALTAAPLHAAGAMMGLFIVFLGAPRKES